MELRALGSKPSRTNSLRWSFEYYPVLKRDELKHETRFKFAYISHLEKWLDWIWIKIHMLMLLTFNFLCKKIRSSVNDEIIFWLNIGKNVNQNNYWNE